MADADVPITAGAGTKIDTRTVGAGTDEHRQVVVIGDPATAANVASADATNGLDVDVTRVIPGTSATHLGKAEDVAHATGDTGVFTLGVANVAGANVAGTDGDYTAFATDLRGVADVNVRQPRTWFAIDVPGVANTAHIAADQLGTIITITNAARQSGGTGCIESIMYYDNDDVVGALDFHFFESSVTLAADDAAYAVSDADNRLKVATLNMTYVVDEGAQRFGQLLGLDVAYQCVGTTSLFLAIQLRAAATFTGGATGQRVKICMIRD